MAMAHRTPLLLALSVSLGALTVGCTVAPDAYEADDSFDTSSAIGVGEAQSRTLHSGDVDYIRLSVAGAEAVTITTDTLDSRVDTVLEVRDANNGFLSENDDYGWGLGSQVTVATDGATDLYLVVTPFAGAGLGHYQLRVDVATGLDAYEPDDWSDQAHPIVPGEEQAHTLHLASDTDWMTVQTVAGEHYRAETHIPQSSAVDTILCLFDSNGVMIADDDDSGVGVASMVEWTGDGNTWWLLAMSYDSYYGVSGAYSVTLDGPGSDGEPTPVPTPTEVGTPGDDTPTPGTDPGEATPTPATDPNDTPEPGDIDNPPTPGIDPGDPTPTAEPGDSTPAGDPNGGTPTPATDPGDDGNGTSGGDPCGTDPAGDSDIGAYRPDAFEPDNSQGEASRLRLGEAQSHNFHTGTDVDWARFEAQAGTSYRVTTTVSACADTDTVLAIVDASGAVLMEVDDAGGGETTRVTATTDGDLFVKVWSYSRDTFGPYELKVGAAD